MPSYRHHELGDLYVQIKVKFPESIDPIDELTLEEPNDRQKRSAASNGDEMDEDDEDGRGPGVACAQRMFFHPLQSIWLMMYRISVMLAF
jgi:DnaJ family protein A protein 2